VVNLSDFTVVPGTAVNAILEGNRKHILDVVSETYLAHERGESVNPDSYFLRFPAKPRSRVIALAGYLGGSVDRIGMKWISSFPDNVRYGMVRASAVLVLNDYGTGRPIACLEAGTISAARTAASAATITSRLLSGAPARSFGFVGAGVIARTIMDYLVQAQIDIADVICYDIDRDSAGHLAEFARTKVAVPVRRGEELTEALAQDVVVFATTSAAPYVPVETELRPDQVLLNVSLRDLPPELLLASNNIVDDIDHCVKAETSPHLAERLSGSRAFINGTIGQAIAGQVRLDPGKATIVSPFGLGILDIAVGSFVLDEALRLGTAIPIAGFFGETRRW
jgi:ornithine cyclodeaminase